MVTYIAPIGQGNCNSTTSLTGGLGSGNSFPIGTNTERYTVTDAAGLTASCAFDITINDTEDAVITLLGDDPLYLCTGDSYIESGATATDNCDPLIGQSIQVISNTTNTSQPGTYSVIYQVTDFRGDITLANRTVIVQGSPAQLAKQNCGNCSQIRFDFCEGEAGPDLEALLMSNVNYGSGNTFDWYADISGSQPQPAMIRVIAYNGNCAGEVRDFSITVNPGVSSRQAKNSLHLAAHRMNAHDVQLDWQIEYEFALSHVELEKLKNDGKWKKTGQQDVRSDSNLTLQDGVFLDRGGMGSVTKYRLKLIHTDGRAIWSQEVSVNFDFYDSKRFTLYPNPSEGRFKLLAAGELEGEWRYKLSDNLARTILIGRLQGKETAFDITAQPAGHYYLILTSPDGKRYLERIVKK